MVAKGKPEATQVVRRGAYKSKGKSAAAVSWLRVGAKTMSGKVLVEAGQMVTGLSRSQVYKVKAGLLTKIEKEARIVNALTACTKELVEVGRGRHTRLSPSARKSKKVSDAEVLALMGKNVAKHGLAGLMPSERTVRRLRKAYPDVGRLRRM